MPDFYKNVGKLAEACRAFAHWNMTFQRRRPEGQCRIQKSTGEFLFRICRGRVAQTSCWPTRSSVPLGGPQKVREALSTLDVSSGYAADGAGAGKVKFGPTARNVYGARSACNGRTATSPACSDRKTARAPLLKT